MTIFFVTVGRRDRDGDKSGGGEAARPLAQLLTLMDGFQKAEGAHVIVIGATNRSDRKGATILNSIFGV